MEQSKIRPRAVIFSEDTESLVVSYKPKEFSLPVPGAAQPYLDAEKDMTNDFKINDLIAKQVGITDQKRKALEDQVQSVVLERMAAVQEKAYQDAYQLGMIEGSEKAYESRKKDFEERIFQLDTVLRNFEDLTQNLVERHEKVLVKMIYLIAEKIAMREIALNPDSVMNVIKKMTENLQLDEQVTIRVSLDDMMFIQGTKEKIKKETNKEMELFQRVKLDIADDLQNGGCIIETNFGTIDATLKERVERVWQAIESKLPRTSGSGGVDT